MAKLPEILDFRACSGNALAMELLLILLIPPLIILLFGFLSYAFYWYEVASSPHRAVFERAAQGRPWRLILRLVGKAMRSQFAAQASGLLGFWPGVYHPRHPDSGTPVLFVHGLYHTAGGWIVMRRRFERAGVGNLYGMTYDSLRKDVPTIAEEVKQRISEVLAAHPGRKVFLVGHSTGGLAIRQALKDKDFAAFVAGVATLGAPHHGSKLAALGIGRTARDLLWGCEFIRKLNSGIQPDLPFLSIYTEFDNMVLPPEATRIPAGTPWREEPAGLSSHVGLLFDRAVTERVLAFYRECAR